MGTPSLFEFLHKHAWLRTDPRPARQRDWTRREASLSPTGG